MSRPSGSRSDGPPDAGALLAAVTRDAAGAAEELGRRLRRRDGDARIRAVERRFLALALLRRGDLAGGRRTARRALIEARALDDPALVAAARLTHATALSLAGSHHAACSEAELALAATARAEQAATMPEVAAVLLRASRFTQALRMLRRASGRLEVEGRLLPAAGARINAAALELERGEPRRALAELDAAERLVEAGAGLPAWLLDVNRAEAHALLGEILEALDLYERAGAEMHRLGIDHRQLDLDELQALLRSGASLEILQRADRLRRGRSVQGTQRAELELLAALAARQRIDYDTAARHAREARRRYRAAGDAHGAATACVVAAEVALAAGARRPVVAALDEARAVALESGDRALAARAEAAASRAAPPGVRALPARAGRYRGDVATEIAVAVARLDHAAGGGSPADVVRELARIVRLRAALARRGAATLRAPAGATTGFVDAAGIALRFALARREPRALAHVARQALVLCGLTAPGPGPSPDGAVDLDLLPVGGVIWRIATRDGRAGAEPLGPPAELVRLARHARGERSLALRPGRTVAPSRDAIEALDALLLPPGLGADAPLVRIRYAGILAGVPWAALPGLQDVPWAHAVAAARRPPPLPPGPPRAVEIVLGPDIPNGAAEAAAVAARYGRSRVAEGDAATAAAVRAALDAAGVAHVIAHAGRRGDDPTLSWLDLAGSRLTAADLADAPVAARCVVLSACDAAAPTGDTASGVISPATSLVRAGARAVVAAAEPVEHVAATALLAHLHDGLAAGQPAHAALLAARRATPESGAGESFVCLVA